MEQHKTVIGDTRDNVVETLKQVNVGNQKPTLAEIIKDRKSIGSSISIEFSIDTLDAYEQIENMMLDLDTMNKMKAEYGLTPIRVSFAYPSLDSVSTLDLLSELGTRIDR